jgi:hypothetical protein
MKQIVESHTGWQGQEGEQFVGLQVTLRLAGGAEDVREFNRLSAADRVHEASRLLEEAGAVDVATPAWAHPAARSAAFDAAMSPGERRLMRDYNARPIGVDAAPRNDRAARLHRALDFVLDCREGKRRRPGRDCNREHDHRDDTRVAADAKLRMQAEPLDDWGRPYPPDAAASLREDAEQTFLAGQREMGVREPYGERAFAYRPGPARAADAGQGGDLEWMQSGAWASTGGVL